MKFAVFYDVQLPTPWSEGDQERMVRETLEHVAAGGLQGSTRSARFGWPSSGALPRPR